jgi:glutamate formiminotransferase
MNRARERDVLIECVPNFSEGRNPAVVDAIVASIRDAGARVLDYSMDEDHNRSVVTFIAPPDVVGEAAFRGIGRAAEVIDLRRHEGVHPRIGAADVVPFVPLEGATLEECAEIAVETGERVWDRLGIPVYLYGSAARRPQCVNLSEIRRGGFEGLSAAALVNSDRRPDIGGPGLHPSAGATVIGARRVLVAFNVNLASADLETARKIARAIRFSSGGLPHVKAMGVLLASRGLAQVSMNLTDIDQTPIHEVLETLRAEARRNGVEIAGAEIVGLVPRRAVEAAAGYYLEIERFHGSRVLENRIDEIP